jgi:hypothetical protein
MDHADADKDDRYQRFAARASAEVLVALLDRLVPRLVPRPHRTEPPRTGGGGVHISGDREVFNGPIAGGDLHERHR